MLNQIIYLDIVGEKPVFKMKEKILVENVNVVDLFFKKYTKEEILKGQEKVMSELNGIIFNIKEVLILLSDNKLSIDTKEELLEQVFTDQIISVNEPNFEVFCDSVGRKITDYFYLYHISSTNSVDKYGILYNYLEEEHSFMFENNERIFRYFQVEDAIHHFLYIFNLYLKIKSIFNSFFHSLLFGIQDDCMLDIVNTYILQYEYFTLFDIFYHDAHTNIPKFDRMHGEEVTRKTYPTFCISMNSILFHNMFPNAEIGLLNKYQSVKDCIILALKNEFEECLINKQGYYCFSKEMKKKYLNCTFVFEDTDNNSYFYLYDDCIVDFDYLFNTISSLKYAYYRMPLFLMSLINKIYASSHKEV